MYAYSLATWTFKSYNSYNILLFLRFTSLPIVYYCVIKHVLDKFSFVTHRGCKFYILYFFICMMYR